MLSTDAETLVSVPDPATSGGAVGGDETEYKTAVPPAVAENVTARIVTSPDALPDPEVIMTGGVPKQRVSEVHEAPEIVNASTVAGPARVLTVCRP